MLRVGGVRSQGVLLALVIALGMLMLAAMPNPVAASVPKVFTVAPSGGDDTGNIRSAFEACVAAGPRCTVRLSAGRFYSNNIFVQNFNGYFRGAGRSATVIDTLRGLDPSLPGLALTQSNPSDPSTLYPYLFFFGFEGGDVTISDLSFDITAAHPAETWIVEDFASNDVRNIVRITGNADSAFERVGFTGHEGIWDPFYGMSFNVGTAITIAGREHLNHPGGSTLFIEPTSGAHTISGCTFDYVEWGVLTGSLTGGKLTVGGTPDETNVFDTPVAALFASDVRGSDVVFSYNDVRSEFMAGAWVLQGFSDVSFDPSLPALSARVFIGHNHIQASGTSDGVALWDFGPLVGAGKTMDAVVADNSIILDNSQYGGVGMLFAQDTVVLGNRISGTGLAGIYMGVSGDTVTGSLLVGNDVQRVEALVAPIWLGPGTSGCIVIGHYTADDVLDEGTGNILLGVH